MNKELKISKKNGFSPRYKSKKCKSKVYKKSSRKKVTKICKKKVSFIETLDIPLQL